MRGNAVGRDVPSARVCRREKERDNRRVRGALAREKVLDYTSFPFLFPRADGLREKDRREEERRMAESDVL